MTHPHQAFRSLLPHFFLASAVCGYAGELSSNGFHKGRLASLGSAPSSSPWSASIGFGVKRLGSLDYRGGSQSNTSLLPSLFSNDTTITPAIGEESLPADRQYQDGFVNQSAITPNNQFTTFWGYNNDSQVNGNEISFTANGSRTATQELLSTSQELDFSDDLYSAVGQLDFRYQLPSRTLGVSSLLISFSLSSGDAGFRGSSFSGSQSQDTFVSTFTDTFALGEVALNLPPAGFQGTFAGPGPAISNLPSNRTFTESLATTDNTTFSNSISSSADIGALSINLGPIFDGKINDRFYWEFSTGVSVTLFDWETQQREELNLNSSTGGNQRLATFTDDDSGIDVGFGVYARASIFYALNEQWFLNSQLQGDLGNSFNIGSGSSEYEFDPSGFSVTIGAGLRF